MPKSTRSAAAGDHGPIRTGLEELIAARDEPADPARLALLRATADELDTQRSRAAGNEQKQVSAAMVDKYDRMLSVFVGEEVAPTNPFLTHGSLPQ